MTGDEKMILVIVPYGEVYVPAATHARLEAWARWVRVPGSLDPRGHCRSIEWKHDSRYPEQERGTPAPDHNLREVLAVERVVCTRLPGRSRDIVRRHFVFLAPPQATARALGIHRVQYGNELRRSVLMVKNCLTRDECRD